MINNKNISVIQFAEGISVYIVGDFPLDMNMINNGLRSAKKKLENWIAKYYLKGIVIGQDQGLVFDTLAWRDLEAMYADGTIFILASKINSAESLALSIIHEFAHVIMKEKANDLVSLIRPEYENKRKQLFDKLEELNYDTSGFNFKITKFNPEFDKFLLDVGYDTLNQSLQSSIVDVYGLVSLDEYFANSMESYLTGKKELVKKLNPSFCKAIQYI
jgi:hypothetical protein